MQLPVHQVERFYAIWMPLMLFVNRRLKLRPEMLPADFSGPWVPAHVKVIRDGLWAEDKLLDDFVAENPAKLSAPDLALVASWHDRRGGQFFILRHLKRYSIFIGGSPSVVYGVVGLASPLEDVIPFVPCFANAVLLPFEEYIIYDSLIAPYNITLGPGYRSDLERTYKYAKERGAVVTTLTPRDRADAAATVGAGNAKVLDAFRAYLYSTGLTPKVVERDLASVSALGEHVLGLPEPRSLSEISAEDVRGYLATIDAAPARAGRRKELLTAAKRFFKFLLNTLRMDYPQANAALQALKKLR